MVHVKEFFIGKSKPLVSEPVLVHYNPSLPIRLAADASSCGIGAMLSHVMDGGFECPIVFASRTLSPSENIYSQIEKEALVLFCSMRKFH